MSISKGDRVEWKKKGVFEILEVTGNQANIKSVDQDYTVLYVNKKDLKLVESTSS